MSQFSIRLATRADLDVVSQHRARMFTDMRELPAEMFESFLAQSRETLRRMVERNEYIGWVATPADQPDMIVAGAGVQLRDVPPHPQPNGSGKIEIVGGRQAIIQNVYTEPAWRRRGLGTLLMKEIISWAQKTGINSLVLHASDEGRALYGKLGFIATTEMRFRG